MQVSGISLKTNTQNYRNNPKSNNRQQMKDQPSFGQTTAQFDKFIISKHEKLIELALDERTGIGRILSNIKTHPLFIDITEGNNMRILSPDNKKFHSVEPIKQYPETSSKYLLDNLEKVSKDLDSYDGFVEGSSTEILAKINHDTKILEDNKNVIGERVKNDLYRGEMTPEIAESYNQEEKDLKSLEQNLAFRLKTYENDQQSANSFFEKDIEQTN